MRSSKQNINLTDIPFPLLSGLRGKGVYVPGLDNKRVLPSAYWVDNVMPTSSGYAACNVSELVSKETLDPNDVAPDPDKNNVYILFNETGETTYGLVSDQKFLVYNAQIGSWDVKLTASSAVLKFSVFYLKGSSYVFHRDLGLFKFGSSFSQLDAVTIKALGSFNPGAGGNVQSMTSARSYIIAVTETEVYWSSALDETEFDPTKDRTAGATKVLSLKGKIQNVLPLADGYVIYTNTNAIIANYSNNPNNPWVYREVANSSGSFRVNHVTFQNSLPYHYVWTVAGLMQVTPQGANPVFPEVTDFLSGDTIERYDEETKEIKRYTGNPLSVKITFVNARYFVISYGIEGEIKDFILLYDLVLKRWGKISIPHKAVFSFIPTERIGGVKFEELKDEDGQFIDLSAVKFSDLAPRISEGSFYAGTVAILAEDNSVQLIDWVESSVPGNGRIIIGDVSLTRNRITTLNQVELEGDLDPDLLKVEVRSLVYNEGWKEATYVPRQDYFVCSTAGKTHEIKIEGNFSLTSVINKLVQDGLE